MVRISKDLDDTIDGDDVLLIEDIVDTGFTTRYLLQTPPAAAPIRSRSALCSTGRSGASCRSPWNTGLEIPDRFVVGFGLDYRQLYRNLGFIAVMSPDKGH